MKSTKKIILQIVIFSWLAFSIVYITYDLWNKYKQNQIIAAYEQGRTDIVNALIEEADKCYIFPVFSGDREIQLIKVDCLNNIEE